VVRSPSLAVSFIRYSSTLRCIGRAQVEPAPHVPQQAFDYGVACAWMLRVPV
jgi:hypothetical protein